MVSFQWSISKDNQVLLECEIKPGFEAISDKIIKRRKITETSIKLHHLLVSSSPRCQTSFWCNLELYKDIFQWRCSNVDAKTSQRSSLRVHITSIPITSSARTCFDHQFTSMWAHSCPWCCLRSQQWVRNCSNAKLNGRISVDKANTGFPWNAFQWWTWQC